MTPDERQAQKMAELFIKGLVSLNDVRRSMGLQPYPIAEAEIPQREKP